MRSLSEYLHSLFANRQQLPTSDDVLAQAEALAHQPPKRVPETNADTDAPTDAEIKPIRIGRLSYAEEQMAWEWDHNSRAKELVQRLKDGFY